MSASDVEFSTPVCLWAQSSSEVFLKLLIPDARKESVAVKVAGGTHLTITAPSASAGGKTYKLELHLHSGVVPTPGTKVQSGSVSVVLAKTAEEPATWPRLLADGQPLDKNKIKIDWDLWQDEDAAAEREAEAIAAAEKVQLSRAWAAESARQSGGAMPPLPDLPAGLTPEQAAAFAKLSASGLDGAASSGLRVTTNPEMVALPTGVRLRASYLLAMNLMVLIGAMMVLFVSTQTLWQNVFPRRNVAVGAEGGKADPTQVPHAGGLEGLWIGLGSIHARVGSLQYGVQALASLEVLHALVGLIQGRVLPSVLLNGGRNIVLFGLIYAFGAPVQTSPWTGLLYIIWCLGDTTRYCYYLMSLLQSSRPARLVADGWLSSGVVAGLTHEPSVQSMMRVRYLLPLFLLPFGFLAELGVLHAALEPAGALLLPLPGLSITVAHALIAYAALAYLLGAPFLYMAVLKQGRSKLKPKAGKGKPTAAKGTAAAASAKKAQ